MNGRRRGLRICSIYLFSLKAVEWLLLCGASHAITPITSEVTTYTFNPKKGLFHDVRTIQIDGEPWFIAADVCKVLGLQNPTTSLKPLDKSEKAKSVIGIGRGSKPLIISESGLYKLIMRSDKPEAKLFQDWVTRDVLPSIRKHGGYIKGQEKGTMSDTELLAQALLVAQRVTEEQKQKILTLSPKADAYDRFLSTSGSFTVTQVAKALGLRSGALLNKILCDNGVIYPQRGFDGCILYWNVRAGFVEQELFTTKFVEDSRGYSRRNMHLTPEGFEFCRKLVGISKESVKC